MKIYVIVEAVHYDTAEVLGVELSMESAKKRADEALAQQKRDFGPWFSYGNSSIRRSAYSDVIIEIHEPKG